MVVWEGCRLAFELLQGRLRRRGAAAARLAAVQPAHFVAFDLLRLAGQDVTAWPYWRRRAALEKLFAEQRLEAPWTLCPSTTDPDTATEWLTWTAVGVEGLCFKPLQGAYRPSVRGWRKYKVRETSEAIVGGVTGPLAAPRSLLLGRFDVEGRLLRYTGRTTTLSGTAGNALASLLTPARSAHPWTGWTFSAGWGTRESLSVTLVEPELVVEVAVDVARDSEGRWRHPARWHRARPDLSPDDEPNTSILKSQVRRQSWSSGGMLWPVTAM